MDVVRDRNVDVLVLLELDNDAVARLEAAGLARRLPYRVFKSVPEGADGSGIASRFPLHERFLVPDSTFAQPSALVDLPGEQDMELVAVHPITPVDSTQGSALWDEELSDLPEQPSSGPVRILAGDFNATLDHAAFRRVLDRGYVDAAETTGAALTPTWPVRRGPGLPAITIDHILVGPECPVFDFDVVNISGSDHRAVFAEFVVPN